MSPEKGSEVQAIFNIGGSKETLEVKIILRTKKKKKNKTPLNQISYDKT